MSSSTLCSLVFDAGGVAFFSSAMVKIVSTDPSFSSVTMVNMESINPSFSPGAKIELSDASSSWDDAVWFVITNEGIEGSSKMVDDASVSVTVEAIDSIGSLSFPLLITFL